MKEERFKWCARREKWRDEWRKIAWSDEVMIQNFSYSKDTVFTTGSSNVSNNFDFTSDINGKFKVNIWGYISYGKFEIFRIYGKFNKDQYLNILNEQGALDSMINNDHPIGFFQQDNLRTDFVKEVTDLIDSKDLFLLPFPRYSPDLTPIENIWTILKELVYNKLNENQVHSEDELWNLCLECWRSIPLATVQKAIDSQPSRCESVMKDFVVNLLK